MTTLPISHKTQKAEYHELLALVARVVAEWDPYALLDSGAPRDEFAHEVALIAAQVPRVKSAREAGRVIAEVFSAAFDPKSCSVEVCSTVGERLFAELIQNGFID
jgi:hypothetical protein